jgi:amino acid transporter
LSFYGGLFAYAGWNYLNMITQELKDPYTNLPRAIYIGLPLVTIIYVLANASYFIVLAPAQIYGNNAVAASFGATTYSVYMQWMIPVFVAMSTFGGVNGTLFTTARMFFAGAEVGQMPEILACVHIKRFTPVPALLFSCVVSLVVMMLGDIGTLLDYVSFILWVSTGLSVGAMIWLRRTQPDLERPIRVSLVWPWLYIIFTTFLVGCSAISSPMETLYGILITLTGVPLYLVFIWWPQRNAGDSLKKKSSGSSTCCVSITSFLQKIFSVIPQEKSETLL